MNQETHAWIAIRAIKLLEDEGKVPGLVRLLKPYSQEASIGAWLPDNRDAKMGSGSTQNHVFKIGLYSGPNKSRFVLNESKLLAAIGQDRLVSSFLKKYDNILDQNWWNQAYKADPPAGKHLANRAMALSISNIDLLIVGDNSVQDQLPNSTEFISKIPPENRSSSGQISLFFFMMSHFIADALMPCHCDERDLSDYDNGLHMELEHHWGNLIGSFFKESNLTGKKLDDDKVLENAKSVDNNFGLVFQNIVPKINSTDIWEEIVLLCRASFGVACVIAPPEKFPFKPGTQVKANFKDIFLDGSQGKSLLAEIDGIIMHDAVLNVAIFWKDIWNKFSNKE